MTPPGNKRFTSSSKFSTLRKLFTKRSTRPSVPIQYPWEKSENSAISNVPFTKSSLNQDPEQRNSDQIQRDPNLTLRTIESVLLASEELDALTSHRQALDSLATKYKEALVKVQKRKATNDHQGLTEKDEQTFFRVLKPITDAERHAYDVTRELFSLLRRTVGFDIMMDAERDRKNETQNLVYLLLKLRLDQEYRSPASNAQKQLFEKAAKLCTQFVNECKPDAKDDAPNGVTPVDATKDAAPTEDTSKDDAPKDDAPKDDAPKDDAPKDDAPKHDASKDEAPKDDAPKDDAPKDDAPKNNAPEDDAPKDDAPKDDAPKHDASKDEAPKDDAPKDDAPKDDAPKDDAPKDDAPKDDAPKDDAPKDDAPKHDASKDEAPKDDAPKDDAPKDDAPKNNAPEDDAPKDDAPKDDAPKHDASKDEAPKDDAPKDDAPKDDAPKDDAPKDDAPKDDAPKDDAPKDDAPDGGAPDGDAPDGGAPDGDAPDGDAPDGDALDHDVLYHNAPKQAGENILIVAGQFTLLELEPQTADTLGNTQKQILAEITKLCGDFLKFGHDVGKADTDDSYLALEEIRCLAKSINKRLGYILAKVEMKPVNQRRELIRLMNLNLNHWMDECRKDVKDVEERKDITGPPQSSEEIGTQTYEG